ncbi:MAG: restriction endonuclease [Anaerolineales bacterium]|nr:restriction endonuclease [Anaerolineales bacterium]
MAKNNVEVTGSEAGLSGDAQIRIALQKIDSNGGVAQMPEIYSAVESRLNGKRLSEQGKASLRRFVNYDAVQAGYLYPHDRNNPGWRITTEGREFVRSDENSSEQVFNVDTDQTEVLPSNTVRGSAFEQYTIKFLRSMYPHYTWYYQGQHKSRERGLDVIGNELGENRSGIQSIGVQIKFHAANTAPTNEEWLKFLAGCFARRLDSAIFVTTGRLTSEQRREAGEARVIVIEGREEIARIAQIYGIEEFDLFT